MKARLRRKVASRAAAPGAGPRLGARSPVRQLLWGAPAAKQVMRDPLTDPTRFDTLHQNLFVNSSAGGTRQPWTAANAAPIRDAFKADVIAEVIANPRSVVGTVSAVTTQADVDAVALGADAAIHTAYPQIPSQLTNAQITQNLVLFTPDFALGSPPVPDYLTNWVENQLTKRTNIETFAIGPRGDPPYDQLVASLVNDANPFPISGIIAAVRALAPSQGMTPAAAEAIVLPQIAGKSWAWLFNRMSSRTKAFAEPSTGRVFVNAGLRAAQARPTLLHELIHLYAHADYRRWVAATTDQRLFNEGFTEILARRVMTQPEEAARTAAGVYAGPVSVINAQIMPFISLDDLTRAFFRGEVWRIEGASAVSQEMFERQVGIAAGATRAQEIAQSRGGAGIVQVVRDNELFRLMNFGSDQSTPKAEHQAFVQSVLVPLVQNDPTVRLRFVGHADDTGTNAQNRVLGRARAAAIYRLAIQLGIPRARLIDVNSPPTGGETDPTASNANVHGRAFNRRVEVFVTHQP